MRVEHLISIVLLKSVPIRTLRIAQLAEKVQDFLRRNAVGLHLPLDEAAPPEVFEFPRPVLVRSLGAALHPAAESRVMRR